jgi:hypothetical protein
VPLPAVRGGGGGGGSGAADAGGGAAGGAVSGDCGGSASVVSRQSGGGGGGGGARSLGAVEARAQHWLSWAQRVVAAASAGAPAGGAAAARATATAAAGVAMAAGGGGGEAGPFAEAAAGLAAAPPYVAPLSALRLVCLHDAAPAEQMPRVFNGALVGLIAGDPAGAAPGASQQPDWPGAAGAPPRPCLGLGLVRAVDAARGALFLLTDARPGALATVAELQVGRLELPQALLAGAAAGAAPYDALFCLNAAASGSGTHKSRNNLLRASLLPQAQRGGVRR